MYQYVLCELRRKRSGGSDSVDVCPRTRLRMVPKSRYYDSENMYLYERSTPLWVPNVRHPSKRSAQHMVCSTSLGATGRLLSPSSPPPALVRYFSLENQHAVVDHIVSQQMVRAKLSDFKSDLPCVQNGTCPVPAFRCPK